MRSGIYVWQLNSVPKYVGKGVDVHRRMKSRHHDNKALHHAISKYGFETFEKEIVCFCEIEELNDLEEFYIRKLHTHRSEGGYNLTWGGDGVGSGEDHPLFGKTGENHPSWGRKHTKEALRRLSDAHKGISHTEEAKRKISDAKRGNKNPSFGRKLEKASSRYLGVSRSIIDNKYVYWKAVVTVNGRSKHIGYFKTEIEAGRAYNEYVVEHQLPYPLNDI